MCKRKKKKEKKTGGENYTLLCNKIHFFYFLFFIISNIIVIILIALITWQVEATLVPIRPTPVNDSVSSSFPFVYLSFSFDYYFILQRGSLTLFGELNILLHASSMTRGFVCRWWAEEGDDEDHSKWIWKHDLAESTGSKVQRLLMESGDERRWRWDSKHKHWMVFIRTGSPSLADWILEPLCFQMMEGDGELTTSQTISASSPSLNSCGLGAFWKVILSVRKRNTQKHYTCLQNI